ncbi:Mitochondrial fission protein [Dipsacomyces acuminosporus]|nr:Mitochondrial fission protein [Dipsacomyces acuminosporus]
MPSLDSATPSLISGFNTFMKGEVHKEHRRQGSSSSAAGSSHKHHSRRQAQQKRSSSSSDQRRPSAVSFVCEEVAPLELSAEEFRSVLDETPGDRTHELLCERRTEYSDYLRQLERARKQIVHKLREVDNMIMEAISERKEIDDRIAAVEQEQASKASDLPQNSNKESAMHDDNKQRLRTTIEDVNDDGEEVGDDDTEQGNGTFIYEQDDAPRLRRLRQLFTGHYGAVTAIDYDPVQRFVASGSLDTQVRVFDSDTGDCQHTINGHGDIIRGVQFYDRFLLTASNDSRIRMWDLSMFESVQPMPSTKILREEYRPRSRQQHVSGSSDDDWDRDNSDNMMYPRRPADGATDEPEHSEKEGRSLLREPQMVMTLQSTTPLMSPTICRHVPPLELCCENTFVGHMDAVTCFQAAEGTLISGSADKTIREWDLSTGMMRQAIDVTWVTRESQSLRLASRRDSAASSPSSPWSLPKTLGRSALMGKATAPAPGLATPRGTDSGDAGFIGALQFYEFALATGTADGALRLWDLRSSQVHRQLFGHTQPITSLHFDDQSILTGSLDGTAVLWDLRSGRSLQKLTLDGPVTDIQLVEGKGQHGLYSAECWIAAQDSKLHRYSSSSMQRDSFVTDFGLVDSSSSRAHALSISSGDAVVTRLQRYGANTLLSGDANGIVKIWDI